MNIIDNEFNRLTSEIKDKTLEEIYNSILVNFSKISPNIQDSLEDYFEKFNYWGKLKRNEGDYEELYNRAKSLKNHIGDYSWLYNNLEDYRSKKVLLAILLNWYRFDFETLNSSMEKNYPHYFDLDIIRCDKEEVIVDLGSYIGDSIQDYLKYYRANNYKRIYCYEITPESFTILKNNLSYYPNIKFIQKAVSDRVEKLYINKNIVDNSANIVNNNGDIEIDATTIDNDIEEKISLIKMDIEGYEQKALVGCANHIKNEHPKLLISVYHNHEDLWKIPTMIKNISKDYKFYLRYYGNNIFPTEIVLIAV